MCSKTTHAATLSATLSFALAFVLVCGLVPTVALAEMKQGITEVVNDESATVPEHSGQETMLEDDELCPDAGKDEMAGETATDSMIEDTLGPSWSASPAEEMEVDSSDMLLTAATSTSEEPDLVDGVYLISHASQLVWVSEQVAGAETFADKTVKLVRNIDLAGSEWSSIGYNLNHYFAGTFDGQNHVISGIAATGAIDSYSIVNAPRHSVGLFGVCRGATVKNLVVSEASVSIHNDSGYVNSYSSIDGTCVYAGAVSGYASDSSFINVQVRDFTVLASVGAESAHAIAGGLVGYAERCSFAHCASEDGSVSSVSSSSMGDDFAGGIVGELVGIGTVRQSHSACTVAGSAQMTGSYVGGLAGKTTSAASDSTLSTIQDCYSRGNVTHQSQLMERAYVGGIVGHSASSILRCYASGAVAATSGGYVVESNVGGIAGSGIASSIVSNCASAPQSLVGGSRFWVAGAGEKEQNVAVAGLGGKNDASTTESRESFMYINVYRDTLGWDFQDVWEIPAVDYPVLRAPSVMVEDDMDELDRALMATSIVLADGDAYDAVTQDFALVGGTKDVAVSWSSSNSEVIATSASRATVCRQQDDYMVKVIATATKDSKSRSKTFRLRVLGTGSSVPAQGSVAGLKDDQARRFVALMRGVRQVDADDPEVLVLTARSRDEAQIAQTMANVMEFMEVPRESSWLRSKMGDIVETIKTGADSEMNELISGLSGIDIKANAATGEVDMQSVAEACAGVCAQPFRLGSAVMDAYSVEKDISDYEVEDNQLYEILQKGSIAEKTVDFFVSHASEDDDAPSFSLGCGKYLKYFKKAEEAIKLMDAAQSTASNGVAAYLKNYMESREYFDDAQSSEFMDIMMDAYAATSPVLDSDDMREFAETLYLLRKRFSKTVGDEYKITISCPVDVYVYDETGKIVARVVDNVVDGSIRDCVDARVVGKNDDQKTIYLAGDSHYSIQLVGNDTGSMTVNIAVGNGNYERRLSYASIELFDGRSMVLDVSRHTLLEEDAPVIMDMEGGAESTAVSSEVQSTARYALSVTELLSSSDGSVAPSMTGGFVRDGFIEAGSRLSDLVTCRQGYRLAGVYADEACTMPYSEDTMPEHGTSLFVLFAQVPEEEQGEDDALGKGSCGGDVTWTLSKSGELRLDGSGSVVLDDGTAPWQPYATEVTRVLVDKDIASLPAGLFSGCTNIEHLSMPYVGLNALATGEDGVLGALFGKSVSGGVVQYHAIEGDTLKGFTYNIPTSLTTVILTNASQLSFGALYNCASITSLELNEGISTVAPYALSGCCGLKSLTIPSSTSEIGEFALAGCDGIERLSLPFVGERNGLNNAQNAVFGIVFGYGEGGVAQRYAEDESYAYSCKHAVPSSLTEVEVRDANHIPYGAFSGCTSLVSITLGTSVRSIDDYAFYGCSALEQVLFGGSELDWGKVATSEKGNDALRDAVITFAVAPEPTIPEPVAPEPISIGECTVTLSESTFVYSGAPMRPTAVVLLGNVKLVPEIDYEVSYTNNTNAGTAMATITGKGAYTDSIDVGFTIRPAASTIRLAAQTRTYAGKALAYTGKVARTGSTGGLTYRYYADAKCAKAVAASSVKAAGTYYVKATVAAKGNYAAATSAPAKLTIKKAPNTLVAKAKKGTLSVSFAKARSKAQTTVLNIAVSKAQGALSYVNASSSKIAKKFSVNKKTGKITIPKGTAKGKYRVRVKVAAKGGANHLAGSKTVTYIIAVK